jgi:hypothetical protein
MLLSTVAIALVVYRLAAHVDWSGAGSWNGLRSAANDHRATMILTMTGRKIRIAVASYVHALLRTQDCMVYQYSRQQGGLERLRSKAVARESQFRL